MDAHTHFGRYKVNATLGKGEMGTVYLAEDPVIGRQVAVKTLRYQHGGAGPVDDAARRRFEREMRVTGTFNHPNIVTVYDVGFEADDAFIAMAYVDGGNLGSLLAAKYTLPFQRIIALISQIASGLDYAHERGVIHRDIKPANILLTGEGAAMVSDFGVARMADSTLTRQGATCGSPAYMSPEQAAAQDVTGASDQFSLAIITYQMLTGEAPFAGQSIATVVYRILRDDPVPPELVNPLVPEAAGKVLMRALSKLPTARYPSCTAFVDAFAGALDVGAESPGGVSSPEQLAATLVADAVPLAEPRNTAAARALTPSPGAPLTPGIAGADRWLRSRAGIELLSGWTSLAARFAGGNRRPLLIAAGFVVVLATGMWLGARLRGEDSTGEPEPSGPVTESAMATVPPGLRGGVPASEPTDTEAEEEAPPLLPAPRPASAFVPRGTDTEPAGATVQATAAASPQAADDAPDPEPKATEPVPAVSEPASAVSDPVPEVPESVPADPDPEPAVADPVPADPDPEPTGVADPEAEDPEAVDTPAAEDPPAETVVPENRWTVVAEGTVPDKLVARALEATTVLDEIMGVPDQAIPSSLLARAGCVAVIPNVKKVGFIFGGRYGRGLVSCRVAGGWSRPSFVSISGGSFGFQIGAQSTDFVLVFVDREAAGRLLGKQFTLGDDASVSAGPVGTTAEAGTDATLRTEIYAYSRSRGLFAGVLLEGAKVATDLEANEDAYGEPLGAEDLLLNDSGRLPAELAAFVQILAAMAAG